MANPVPRGQLLSFFIQTMTKKATGGAKAPRLPMLTIVRVGKGVEPQPSPWTAGEKFLPAPDGEDWGASRKFGEYLPQTLLMPVVGDEAGLKATTREPAHTDSSHAGECINYVTCCQESLGNPAGHKTGADPLEKLPAPFPSTCSQLPILFFAWGCHPD